MNDQRIEFIDERSIPRLVDDLTYKNTQIRDLESHIETLSQARDLLEQENQRLRRFITDMQHRYESMAQRRDWEIESLNGKVVYLEEELLNLQRKPQQPIVSVAKDTYDPNLFKDLERKLKLKDDEIDTLKRLLKDQQERQQLKQEEVVKFERKQIQNEQQSKMMDLPFVLENEQLKKQLVETRRLLDLTNDDLRELRSLNANSVQEIEKYKRKIRELEILLKAKQEQDVAYKEAIPPVYVKVNQDENLLQGAIGLVHYVRESLCNTIFEIFIRSANQAQTKKTNSTIIFSINMKELKERNTKGLLIVIFLYKKMKEFIKVYFPYYSKIGLEDEMANKKNAYQEGKHPSNFRDNANQWLEGNLAICMNQFKESKKDQHKEYFHLYRLLALKYRCMYPMKSDQPLRLDLDVRVRLEHKICASLARIFID